MKVEETIQMLFDDFGMVCNTREIALRYLFCVLGNGYDWKNGELVSYHKKKFKGKLSDEGIAIQRKTEQDITNELLYSTLLQCTPKKYKKAIKSEEFKKRLENLDEKESYLFNYSFELIKSARKVVLNYEICEYSPINNIPKNITKDWEKAYFEILEILENQKKWNDSCENLVKVLDVYMEKCRKI